MSRQRRVARQIAERRLRGDETTQSACCSTEQPNRTGVTPDDGKHAAGLPRGSADTWKGHRYSRPITAWVCSETTILLRDVMQKLLFGEPEDSEAFGSGTIALDLIDNKKPIHGARYSGQLRHRAGQARERRHFDN